MKKASKSIIPTIYEGLTENQGNLIKQCIIIDKHGQIFRFNNPSEDHIVKEAVAFKFTNYNEFDDQIKPSEMIEWHQKYFDNAIPDGITAKNSAQVSAYVWLKLCKLAKDRTTTPKDPETGTKSKNSARKYFRCLNPDGTPVQSALKTPQATTCLIILEATVKENTLNGTKVLECTEAELKAAIISRAPELKTRQDPWRIFQYYRPQLISAGVIKSN